MEIKKTGRLTFPVSASSRPHPLYEAAESIAYPKATSQLNKNSATAVPSGFHVTV